MLVLSRQRDETIMIGDDIEITIVDIRGDKVRLGITAPATIPVHRKEVYEAIQRENREAARVKMEDLQALPRGKPAAIPPGLHRPPAAARPGSPGGGGDRRNSPAPPAAAPNAAPPSAPPAASNGSLPASNGSSPATPLNPGINPESRPA
jgi:carbon storage regulator